MQELLARESPALPGKRLIAINPNASKLISIRKWPLDRYAQLVARLLEDPRNVCAITGLASEREDARFILDRVKSDRLVDLTGKTSLRESDRPVQSGRRAGHERQRPRAFRRADRHPRRGVLRARDAASVQAADRPLHGDVLGLRVQPVRIGVQPAPVRLHEQPVSTGHLR